MVRWHLPSKCVEKHSRGLSQCCSCFELGANGSTRVEGEQSTFYVLAPSCLRLTLGQFRSLSDTPTAET